MSFLLDEDADYRLSVYGAAEGIPSDNHHDYRCVDLTNGATTSADVLLAFRAMYRASFLPLLANTYFVRAYTFERIGGLNTIGNSRASLRMDRDDQLLGVAVDDDGGNVGPPNATFSALSMTKKTLELEMGWAFLPQVIPAGQNFRITGGNRFGPVPEDPTIIPTGNRFSPAYFTLAQDAALALVAPLVTAGNGATLEQQVLSLVWNGLERTGTPNVGRVYVRGPVLTITPKRKVSSQVSRKDTSDF